MFFRSPMGLFHEVIEAKPLILRLNKGKINGVRPKKQF